MRPFRLALSATILLVVLPALPALPAGEEKPIADLVAVSDRIDGLLRERKFRKAEPLVRRCIAQVPEDIHFLANLDVILNGTGRLDEAERVREEIVGLWRDRYREGWVARGRPVAESSWARLIFETERHLLMVAEYHEPQRTVSEDGTPREAFFKAVATPRKKGEPVRLLKVERIGHEESTRLFVLSEVFDRMIKPVHPYGDRLPSVHEIAEDVRARLAEEEWRQ